MKKGYFMGKEGQYGYCPYCGCGKLVKGGWNNAYRPPKKQYMCTNKACRTKTVNPMPDRGV